MVINLESIYPLPKTERSQKRIEYRDTHVIK